MQYEWSIYFSALSNDILENDEIQLKRFVVLFSTLQHTFEYRRTFFLLSSVSLFLIRLQNTIDRCSKYFTILSLSFTHCTNVDDDDDPQHCHH
jgi:hypothetical protein